MKLQWPRQSINYAFAGEAEILCAYWLLNIGMRLGCQMVFSHPKSQFGLIVEGIAMENVGIFYGPLECFTAIWNIFGHVVILYICSHLVCMYICIYKAPFW
jgi:hypothetical protein